MRWAIDTRNLEQVVATRRAIVEEIRPILRSNEDLFAAELIVGEVLSAEAAQQRTAIALELDVQPDSAILHVYDQGAAFAVPSEESVALINALATQMTVETSEQGNYIAVKLQSKKE